MKIRRNGALIMAKLIALLGNFAYFLIFAVINGSLGYLCALGVTSFGSLGIAKILGENIRISYGFIISAILICGIMRGALKYIEQYSNHYIAFRLLAIIRDKVFKALRKLAPAGLEDERKGNLIAMVTADIETLEVFYAHTLSPIMISIVVSTVVLLFVSFSSSYILALVALVFYILIGVITPLIMSKKTKESGVIYRKELASFNAYYLDSISGIRDIVLHNCVDKRGIEINKRSEKLLNETKKLKHYSSIFQSLTELFVGIAIVVTLVIGIILIEFDKISIGRMLVGVVTIFSSFGPIIAIANLPKDLTQTFASGDRVLNLLEEKPIVEEIKNKNDFVFESLNVDNLSFGYNKDLVLKNINLDLKKGTIIGIEGESGCGKSTLLKLLLRFYDNYSGSISYNGLNINSINTSSLLKNVTIVFQNTYLFDDSIINNLKIAKEDATIDEIIDACKKASIHDFIMTLSEGYNTRIGPYLENISAGERQRIGLARAFLRESSVILLDEPTSNVDSINEGIILKSILKQKDNKCIILVSHRESTISICDVKYRFINKTLIKEKI